MQASTLLDFAQIAGTLGGFGLPWPKSLDKILGFCGILDFDLDVTGPMCIMSWTWAHDLVLQLSLPVVVGLINVLEHATCSVLEPAHDPQYSRAKVISKYFSFVNCQYMTLVRYSLAAFACIDVNAVGFSVLKADPNVDCYSTEHIWLMGLGSVGILLYCIGFPLMSVVALSMIDKRQEHNNRLRILQFGNLYSRYSKPTRKEGCALAVLWCGTPRVS